MKNKVPLIMSILFIVAGALIGFFAKFDGADLTAFAMTMFGAGLAVSQLWEKKNPEAKKPLVILAIVLVGAGAFIAGLTRMITEEQVAQIIGYVIALALLIAGIVSNVIANKAQKKLN